MTPDSTVFDTALQVAGVVAPVFALAAVGWGWVRAGLDYPVAFVTRLAMTVAVPALIYDALSTSPLEVRALASVAGAAALAYAALWAVFHLALSGRDRRTWLAPLVFGNTGNLGLPIALFAYGETGLALAVAVFAVMALGTFTLGVWSVSGGSMGWATLREPVVIATLLGAASLATGLRPPQPLAQAVSLAGQMAIPMMLITLGVAVSRLDARGLGRAAAWSALKLVVCAAAALAVARALGLGDVATAVLVLQLATPVAVTSYLLAERHGADAGTVAGLVVASTSMSVVGLPLILALTG
ncbi:MAG: AEC family transporter [Paracoccaceae bacterium]